MKSYQPPPLSPDHGAAGLYKNLIDGQRGSLRDDGLIRVRSVSATVRGALITFEGIDGSGKTTISRLVARRLRAKGLRVHLTSEPTSGWTGEAVRRSYEDDVGPIAESFLFLADRARHLVDIRERLEAGELVVCDRYADSTYAYQGARLRGRLRDPIGFLRRVSEPWLIRPDLTILLRVPPELGMKRLGQRPRNLRFEDLSFLRRVATNYDRLAKDRRFVVIDGRGDADEVAEKALAAIGRRIRISRA